MELKLLKKETTKLDNIREKTIKQYLELQEDFKALVEKWLVDTIIINKIQNELAIDLLTEWQRKALDDCKNKSDREIIIKKYPHMDIPYTYYIVRPYIVIKDWDRFAESMDTLETTHIEIINEAIKEKIDTYKIFIKK